MDGVVSNKLSEIGWNPSNRFSDVDHWHFFEIRNFNILRVVCLVEQGPSTKEEVQRIKIYLSQKMPWLSLRDMGLTICFLETPQFVDLSGCLSKYAEKVTVQKVIQLTPDKVYEQNTWVTGIIDQYLGNFLSEIAGLRQVVTSKIDGGLIEKAWKKNWLWYAALIIAALGILRYLLK